MNLVRCDLAVRPIIFAVVESDDHARLPTRGRERLDLLADLESGTTSELLFERGEFPVGEQTVVKKFADALLIHSNANEHDLLLGLIRPLLNLSRPPSREPFEGKVAARV